MEYPDDFAVFILTHGRPEKVLTFDTLRRQGYTGPIYLIVDNEDKSIGEYRRRYGDQVVLFDKLAISKTFDEADNFNDRRAVVYARNASFQIARDLGLTYFLQLDDDYNQFKYRINHKLQHPEDVFMVRTHLDSVFIAILEYYKSIPACSIATLQGGDFFGGAEAFGRPKRKCMNTFFCSVDRQFQFVGRINEDVNTYTWYQSLGNLFLSIPFIQVDQLPTQGNTGGMTGLYLDGGTYIKSFYTVIFAPNCTKIRLMGQKHMRLHHSIIWANAVPCIIDEKWRN